MRHRVPAERLLHFNPLPPHGGRLRPFAGLDVLHEFQSTPSTRRETRGDVFFADFGTFQSTPSTRRETLFLNEDSFDIVFQSTPSTRRETYISPRENFSQSFQSTPSTRRETCTDLRNLRRRTISIHSLHTEGDSFPARKRTLELYFNPLPPHGGRLCFLPGVPSRDNISIHSLHTEGDRQ